MHCELMGDGTGTLFRPVLNSNNSTPHQGPIHSHAPRDNCLRSDRTNRIGARVKHRIQTLQEEPAVMGWKVS